jgi:hypothetical protein
MLLCPINLQKILLEEQNDNCQRGLTKCDILAVGKANRIGFWYTAYTSQCAH